MLLDSQDAADTAGAVDPLASQEKDGAVDNEESLGPVGTFQTVASPDTVGVARETLRTLLADKTLQTL